MSTSAQTNTRIRSIKNYYQANKNLLQISFTTNIFTTYETMISGYVAAIVGHLFFKSNSEIISIILSFIVFASSFLIQPIGSIFWGYIGDKYNAGIATKYSMILMSIPTGLIGFLPTYASIGYYATITLVFLRLIQGFCSGGQTATNSCYVFENTAHTKDSNWFCGLVACGGWVGSLIASVVAFCLYYTFTDNSINSWAWRIPFLISIPMSLMIFHFRKNIKFNENGLTTKNIETLFNLKFLRPFIKCLILLSFMQVSFYMLFMWLPTYLGSFLGVSHEYATLSNVITLVAAIISVATWGYLGIHINYKKILLTSVILLVLLSYPLFALLQNASIFQLIMVQLAFVCLYTPIEGNYIYAIGKAFQPSVRNRGYSMSWAISNALCGGTTPMICTYFTHILKFNQFPIIYLIFFGILTIPAVILI